MILLSFWETNKKLNVLKPNDQWPTDLKPNDLKLNSNHRSETSKPTRSTTSDLYFCFIARNPGRSSSSFNPSLLTTTPRTAVSPFWAWSMGFTSMDLADPDPENLDLLRKPPPETHQPPHHWPPPHYNLATQISQKSWTQPKLDSRQPMA